MITAMKLPEMPEVEIHIGGHVIKGTFVSGQNHFSELATENGCRTFGSREFVTVTVKVDG